MAVGVGEVKIQSSLDTEIKDKREERVRKLQLQLEVHERHRSLRTGYIYHDNQELTSKNKASLIQW